MILRPNLTQRILSGIRRSPVTAIVGPRQCGKSTIARQIARSTPSHYFDLEDPEDDRRLQEPKLNLTRLEGLIVLDEIQRRPDLLPVLRVLVDQPERRYRFLLLGSASPGLMRGSSETLAGRIEYVEMSGFDISEIDATLHERLWLRGGFPLAFLANTDEDSRVWRENFIRTFLERDLARIGVSFAPETLRRFWTMLAHYHGQVWNASAIGRSLGVSHHTTISYLDALAGAFVLRRIEPWFENLGKRLVKAPKIFIRDSGLVHSLLGVPERTAILGHPKLGASWEGFAMEQVLSYTGTRGVYFYGTHGGAELDLFLLRNGKRWGVEFKWADAPGMTKSLHSSLTDLSLESACIVYPGTKRYSVHERVDCVGLALFHEWASEKGMLQAD